MSRITSRTNTKPTVAKRVVGTAAALALAAGLAVTAPVAEAEAASVWDRVATCESGGRWSINTGNGYYGGLQFSRSTWRAFGGAKYASTANKASKSQQIKVAQRTLKSQGPGAWPVCSKRAGLTRSNGAASSGGSTKAKKSTKAKPSKKKATKKSTRATKTVSVRGGDTLAGIAQRYHVKGGWKALWKMNKKSVKNPNMIRVGQSLRVR